MSEENFSALAAVTKLRDSIETMLQANEDYRALKALERALREVSSSQPNVRQLQAQACAAAQTLRNDGSDHAKGRASEAKPPAPALGTASLAGNPGGVKIADLPNLEMLETMLSGAERDTPRLR